MNESWTEDDLGSFRSRATGLGWIDAFDGKGNEVFVAPPLGRDLRPAYYHPARSGRLWYGYLTEDDQIELSGGGTPAEVMMDLDTWEEQRNELHELRKLEGRATKLWGAWRDAR